MTSSERFAPTSWGCHWHPADAPQRGRQKFVFVLTSAAARDSAINEALMFSVKNEIFILPLRRKNSTVQAKRVLDFSDA